MEHVGAGDEHTLMAHSTGGLIGACGRTGIPGGSRALVLNSPWLETQGSGLVRRAAGAVLDPVSRLRPEAGIEAAGGGVCYWQSISREGHGHWDLHPCAPAGSFPVTRRGG